MLKLHNGKMIYESNGDKVVLIPHTTEDMVNRFEAYLKNMYGRIPIVRDIIYELDFFNH